MSEVMAAGVVSPSTSRPGPTTFARMPLFSALGVDFPLFAADLGDASAWSTGGVCVLCSERLPGFTLGVGDEVILSCGSCASDTAAGVDGREQPCYACGQSVAAPHPVEGEHACWQCLRSGRWSSIIDTEAGMVRWEDAMRGRTHGMPFAAHPTVFVVGGSGTEEMAHSHAPSVSGFATSEPNDDGWRGVLIPSDILLELVRTPRYVTWQGERWLFHCQRAMRYIGRWGKLQFGAAAADGDGRALAFAAADLNAETWDYGLADQPSSNSSVTVYMFRCTQCGEHRGHWDSD